MIFETSIKPLILPLYFSVLLLAHSLSQPSTDIVGNTFAKFLSSLPPARYRGRQSVTVLTILSSSRTFLVASLEIVPLRHSSPLHDNTPTFNSIITSPS